MLSVNPSKWQRLLCKGQKDLHQPGVEPGPIAWKAIILPLDHWGRGFVTSPLKVGWLCVQYGGTSWLLTIYPFEFCGLQIEIVRNGAYLIGSQPQLLQCCVFVSRTCFDTCKSLLRDWSWTCCVINLNLMTANVAFLHTLCPAHCPNTQFHFAPGLFNLLSHKYQLFQWLTLVILVLHIGNEPPREDCTKYHR